MYNFAIDIKHSVSVRDICDRYGIEVNRAGFAKCPFHNEKTASMRVFKDGVKCFGCGEYALTSIDFVMKLFGLSFYDACVKINSDFCLNLPIGKQPTLREIRESEKRLKEIREKRKAEQAEHDRLYNAYHKAYDEWAKLDRQRMDNLPKSIYNINDKYADALKRLPIAADALDKAELELYRYDHRRENNR